MKRFIKFAIASQVAFWTAQVGLAVAGGSFVAGYGIGVASVLALVWAAHKWL